MGPIWVVIYWVGMDERMLGAATRPCCLLASRAWKFPKGGEIWMKVCGELPMDPAKRFRAFAKKNQKLGNLAYYRNNFVGPSLGPSMGVTILGYDCTTHGMPRVWILG